LRGGGKRSLWKVITGIVSGTVSRELLIFYEQLCLDKLLHQYNICKTAGSCLGRKLSAKSRKKISDGNKGKKFSKEARMKISKTHKGRKWPPEFGRKISKAKMGFKFSEESKRKMSESHKGQLPACTKYWGDIKSPDGIIYENVFNLAAFCREHDLHSICMSRVVKEQRPQHKGWTKA